jgi:hypothetical protein
MHLHPVFDESFLVQIATQLSRQRNELDRLRRAAAERSHSNKGPRHAAAATPENGQTLRHRLSLTEWLRPTAK